MNRDIKFLNAFNSIPGVGPATIRTLKNHFGDYESAWRAEDATLEHLGIAPIPLRSILWKRPSTNPDREMEKLIKENIWLITEEDQNYPPQLKEIAYPPLCLYGRGMPQWSEDLSMNRCFAVVGTRRPTQYGLEATETLTQELAAAGLTIVSGLATGIDTRAHEAALISGGKTIAVVGSGLDSFSLFPQENRGLARRIQNAGSTLLSEYAPGTPALKEHFPQRNRIISGLSRSVLIVEARERSGALITARLALEQNRDVFAIPGSIFSPLSRGTHALIQEGAKLVTSAKDILEEFGIEYTKSTPSDIAALTKEEEAILTLLIEPCAVDHLKAKTQFETSTIVASLSMLELKGLIKNMGNDTYQKI